MSESTDDQGKKQFDQFGNDITTTLKKEKEMEIVKISVTREDLEQLYKDRHERFSKAELSRQGQFLMALAHIQGAKALLSVTTKEKAKEAMANAIGDFAYMEGRAAAAVRGNPKDMESYKKYEMSSFQSAPFIPYVEILEETDTVQVIGIQKCPWAESIREMAEMFPDYVTQDVIEVVASRCDKLDSGRIEGFNPKLKMDRVEFILNDLIGNPPSKGCYFETGLRDK